MVIKKTESKINSIIREKKFTKKALSDFTFVKLKHNIGRILYATEINLLLRKISKIRRQPIVISVLFFIAVKNNT